MQDIARAAGVSQSTVSRVLNSATTSIPIADDTKQRILQAADRLGYRPNPLARGLRGMRTMLLGVIVREITDPFFASAVEALSGQARELGYNVVLGSAHSRADEAIALRAVLETRHCDAIVLLGDMRDQPRLLADLQDSNTPVVAIWQGTNLDGVPTINIDNRAGIKAAMDHLVNLGHRHFGFIGGRPLGDIRERRAAFVDYLSGLGITPPENHLQTVSNDPQGGYRAFRHLMSLSQPPTAVIATTDHLATGVLNAAYSLGIEVPAQVSVVGFDDLPLAAYTVPPLTTVKMPIRDMTGAAITLAIEHDAQRRENLLLTPSLVIRESTGPASNHQPGR
jgi:DNA-binding LacI/PurR family transcriptional regulator